MSFCIVRNTMKETGFSTVLNWDMSCSENYRKCSNEHRVCVGGAEHGDLERQSKKRLWERMFPETFIHYPCWHFKPSRSGWPVPLPHLYGFHTLIFCFLVTLTQFSKGISSRHQSLTLWSPLSFPSTHSSASSINGNQACRRQHVALRVRGLAGLHETFYTKF